MAQGKNMMKLMSQDDCRNADQFDNLRQLTLVVPTYNRPQFLARLLSYYAGKNTELYFLILDSSDAQARVLNKQAAHILGERAKYFDFPSSTPVANKLLEGLKLVDTQYCAFCADDDLVFVDGLAQALSFLQTNSAYVCVDGIYLNFNPVGADIDLIVEYANNGINAEDPGARVFQLYQKYESIFYGVFRTRDALSIFSGVSKNPSLHYQELFQATSALLMGKSHRLPIFYAARQHCNPADMKRDKWQTYYWFTDNPREFIDHYLIYRTELWNFYQDHVAEKKYEKDSFLKLMDVIHAMYFGLGCPPAYFYSVFQQYWPNDVYQKHHHFDDICNQLKGSKRLWFESQVEQFSIMLTKLATSFYPMGAVRKLNHEIKRKINTRWNCKLERRLRWLATVPNFQNTCLELCRYMGV